MGLEKLAAKVIEYNARLESGKASKIKPDDVKKVLKKLRKKSATIQSEIDGATSPEKKSQLQNRLGIAQAHIARAEWLLKEIR